MMLTVTVEDVIARGPCYLSDPAKGEAYMRTIYAGRERWSALQIATELWKAYTIPANDILWTILHKSLIDARTLRHLACDFAEQAIKVSGRPADPRSLNAIRVARLFADGKATSDELAAAWVSAGPAAWDAAGAAAWNAAWDAAGTAGDAAWVAWAAARDARAAGDAWDAQLKHVIRVLKGERRSTSTKRKQTKGAKHVRKDDIVPLQPNRTQAVVRRQLLAQQKPRDAGNKR